MADRVPSGRSGWGVLMEDSHGQQQQTPREGLSRAHIDFVRGIVLRAPIRFALIAACTCLAYFAWSMSGAPVYRATVKLRVEDIAAKSPQLEHRSIPGGTIDEGEALTILRSRTLLESIVAPPSRGTAGATDHSLGLTTWVTDESGAPLRRFLRQHLIEARHDDFALAAQATRESDRAPYAVRVRFTEPTRVSLSTVNVKPGVEWTEDHIEERRFVPGRDIVYRGLRLALDVTGTPDGRVWLVEALDVQAAIDRVAAKVRIDKQQHQPGTLGIVVTDDDAQRAADIANAIACAFVDTDLEVARARADEKAKYLEGELESRRGVLDELQGKRTTLLVDFPDVVSPDAAAAELAQREGAWEDKFRRASADRIAAERALELMQNGVPVRSALASLSSGIPTEVIPLRDALGHEESRLRGILQGSNDKGYRRTLLLKADDYTLEAQTFETRVADLREIIAAVQSGDEASLSRLGGDLAREGSISVDWNVRLWLTELQQARGQLESLRREFKEKAPHVVATKKIVAHYRAEIIAGLRAQLRGLEGTRARKAEHAEFWRDLFARFPEDEARLIRASIGEIQSEIIATFSQYVDGKRFEEVQAERERDRLRQRVRAIALAERELARSEPERVQLESIVGDLLRDIENAKIAAAGVEPSVRIIDPASRPRGMVKPRAAFGLVAGLLLGLMTAIAWAWFSFSRDSGTRSTSGRSESAGINILGRVAISGPGRTAGNGPRRSAFKLRSLATRDGQLWLPVLGEPDSEAAFDYRLLRERVLGALAPKSASAIGIVGTKTEVGASTVALNLAVGMAQLGKRVLLVDGAMRRPRLFKAIDAAGLLTEREALEFGDWAGGAADGSGSRLAPGTATGRAPESSLGAGLGEALDGTADWRHCVTKAHFPAMDFIDSGRSLIASTDLFAGRRFERFVRWARDSYDVVIIDFSAAADTPDAQVAARYLDGCMLVTDVLDQEVERLGATLKRAGGSVLGAVEGLRVERRAETGGARRASARAVG